MKRSVPALLLAAFATLSACGMFAGNKEVESNSAYSFGSITAAALQGGGWTVLADLPSAPPGEVVARHETNNFCAYARGDGTFYTAPCPG